MDLSTPLHSSFPSTEIENTTLTPLSIAYAQAQTLQQATYHHLKQQNDLKRTLFFDLFKSLGFSQNHTSLNSTISTPFSEPSIEPITPCITFQSISSESFHISNPFTSSSSSSFSQEGAVIAYEPLRSSFFNHLHSTSSSESSLNESISKWFTILSVSVVTSPNPFGITATAHIKNISEIAFSNLSLIPTLSSNTLNGTSSFYLHSTNRSLSSLMPHTSSTLSCFIEWPEPFPFIQDFAVSHSIHLTLFFNTPSTSISSFSSSSSLTSYHFPLGSFPIQVSSSISVPSFILTSFLKYPIQLTFQAKSHHSTNVVELFHLFQPQFEFFKVTTLSPLKDKLEAVSSEFPASMTLFFSSDSSNTSTFSTMTIPPSSWNTFVIEFYTLTDRIMVTLLSRIKLVFEKCLPNTSIRYISSFTLIPDLPSSQLPEVFKDLFQTPMDQWNTDFLLKMYLALGQHFSKP